MGVYGTKCALADLADLKRMLERQPHSLTLHGLVASKEAQIAYIRSQPNGDKDGHSHLESDPGFPCLTVEQLDDDSRIIAIPVQGVRTNEISALHPELLEDGELTDEGVALRRKHLMFMTYFEARELGQALLRLADQAESEREERLARQAEYAHG